MTFSEVAETSCNVEPGIEVIQRESLKDIKAYLLELESRIAELKALLLENENQKASQSPLFRQSTLKTDGLEAIRTPDLRRVKAMS
jgi:hypothetical protein